MPNTSKEPTAPTIAKNQDLKDMDGCSLHLQNSDGEPKFCNMAVPQTTDHIWIQIKMPNPGQDPPASSEAPNQDLKDMHVLRTFKIKIGSQNLEDGYIKD